MTDRSRVRVGRDVAYFPTDAEAVTGNGSSGDAWPATISNVNTDGTVNLSVIEADGGLIAKLNVARGTTVGTYNATVGLAGKSP